MHNKDKKLTVILIVIFIIILIISFFINKIGNDKNEIQEQTQDTETGEKFVRVLEDGTKLNISEKLNETKNVEGIEISNIQFTYKDGQTVLLADVTNNSGKAIGITLLNIKLLDEQENEIITIGGIISPMQVGETTQLNAGMTMDYANAYDVEITFKK